VKKKLARKKGGLAGESERNVPAKEGSNKKKNKNVVPSRGAPKSNWQRGGAYNL